MSVLNEAWIQEVMETLKLPALSPAMCNVILPVIEMHMKKISQQAHKFQRRGKSAKLSVSDLNVALTMNKIEPVYGLGLNESVEELLPITVLPKHSDGSSIVNLVETAKAANLTCPLMSELSLHWLAVDGHQPLISENPSVVSTETEEQPHSLPKEMQHLYARITGIILSAADSTGSSPALKTVYRVLETDAGINDLTPYFSRFFYQQIKTNTKRLSLLYSVIRSIRALLANPHINLQSHLMQLLPVIFTCIVSPKLSTLSADDHWSLRCTAADIIAHICTKYKEHFLDLQPRVYKTYVEALGPDKSLVTLFGGIVGIIALGRGAIRSLLVQEEQLLQIHNRLTEDRHCDTSATGTKTPMLIKSEKLTTDYSNTNPISGQKRKMNESASTGTKSGSIAAAAAEDTLNKEMCKAVMLKALGCHMVASMRLSTPQAFIQGNASKRSIAQSGTKSKEIKSMPLCDLEEALVPHYAVASTEDYYCRLTI